ncbi:MAG: formyltransferase family protein [Eubacteriales bacterium]
MHYELVLFGVKDTTEEIVDYIEQNLRKISLVITIDPCVLDKNHVAGYKGLSVLEESYGIQVYETKSYGLNDVETKKFFHENTFEIGISMGWQRIIPGEVLDAFHHGIFGFHGSCGYLPYGRGRSPLNWSIINGDRRFILNLFQYDENPDSPNVFANEMFGITEYDTIRTLQYKNIIVSKRLIKRLIDAYEKNSIQINKCSKDIDSWYGKRTAKDGKLDFTKKTRELYNLIRGVSEPFPGAFAYCKEEKVTIWEAYPFDEMLDFSEYQVGEVIENMDDCFVVRTIDGSLVIKRYEANCAIAVGDIML